MNQFQTRKLDFFLNQNQKIFKRLFNLIKTRKIEFLLNRLGKTLEFFTSPFYKLDNTLNRFIKEVVFLDYFIKIDKPIAKTTSDF